MTDDVFAASAKLATMQDRPEPMPGWMTALRRGLGMRCPSCGAAPAFDGYLHVRSTCPRCAAPLGRVPCDDAPPYLTLLISLHVIALLAVLVDRGGALSSATMLAIFLPFTLVLVLLLLRPIKGAILAVMLKVNLVGASPDDATGRGHAAAGGSHDGNSPGGNSHG